MNKEKNYRVIVYTYVCGDILHKGHLLYLKNCKKMGDVLIVGVLTDDAVMEKKDKPIISFEERLEMVGSLECVDVAVPQDDYAPWKNIKNIKPDILIESESHDDNILNGSRKIVDNIGGRLIIIPYYPLQSSTIIKNKIKKGI